MTSEVISNHLDKNGFKHLVLYVNDSHHCGYLGVPRDHPLYLAYYDEAQACLTVPDKENYDIGKRSVITAIGHLFNAATNTPENVFDVHGSLTFSGFLKEEIDPHKDFWFLGFDCAHLGDKLNSPHSSSEGEFRTAEYVSAELESLAKQVVEKTIMPADR